MKGGALVLAAGVASRFGSDKRQYDVDGKPLLARTVEQVKEAGLACRVCIRPGDGHIPLLLGLPDIEFIECPLAAEGMGRSLAEGVARCGDWQGLLVVLGDMAWTRPATLASLFDALTPETIVQPVYADRTGNPVAFGARFFPDLLQLGGDRGGRDLLLKYSDAVTRLEVDDPGIHRDLDRPEPSGH